MRLSVRINWYLVFSGVVLSLFGYMALDFTGLYYIVLSYFEPPLRPMDDTHYLMNYVIAFFSLMVAGAAIALLGIIRILLLDRTQID